MQNPAAPEVDVPEFLVAVLSEAFGAALVALLVAAARRLARGSVRLPAAG